MKKLYILLIALLAINGATAQPCLPQGIGFHNQASINNFHINHPNCTEIEGTVSIMGNNITNLNGLGVVTSIGGGLYIQNIGALTSLTGLNNLTSIGGDLYIRESGALTSLTGLENLTTIGGDFYIDNTNLTSLTGLGILASIGGDFLIQYNGALTNLTGLENLTSIGGIFAIYDNPALIDLTGLENLTSIGGQLSIFENFALTSITGLDNIDAGSINQLEIFSNPSLSDCEGHGICDYIANPNGSIYIGMNATGCNSPEEVQARCALPTEVPISTWALVLGGVLIAFGVFVRHQRVA